MFYTQTKLDLNLTVHKSTSNQFEGNIHCNFVPIFKNDLQIDFKVHIAP